jgi:transcriptional regulator with XRE-family HTH domain
MSINIYFGRVVKELRCRHHLSQEELAEKANLNRTYFGEVERGIAAPSLITVGKIAAALDMSSADLVAQSEQLLRLENNHSRQSGAEKSTSVLL